MFSKGVAKQSVVPPFISVSPAKLLMGAFRAGGARKWMTGARSTTGDCCGNRLHCSGQLPKDPRSKAALDLLDRHGGKAQKPPSLV